jgi:hypothetical protein
MRYEIEETFLVEEVVRPNEMVRSFAGASTLFPFAQNASHPSSRISVDLFERPLAVAFPEVVENSPHERKQFSTDCLNTVGSVAAGLLSNAVDDALLTLIAGPALHAFIVPSKKVETFVKMYYTGFLGAQL